MKKINLPAIIDEAKSKPLSYNPQSDSFVLYDEVASGDKKIYPLSLLDKQLRLKLVIERYKKSVEDNMISTLNGEMYSKADIIDEIKRNTSVGQNFFNLDFNYLEYYVSTFPEEVFGE
ncbi:hypothetical protein [Chryseobacterium caseinilyticum]|uniref:Uncharacterized protein n=1 Tax=Chryseobacterium caseinilyticum TaxID=2771428 RepID=A0ABR8ZEL4_9FLAO|nr:hypothetical protein [Chryseobacterium caseinilyticum]MBD8083335.1 hypothetical protein [Chryseobacterium caseinilyticum]